VPAALGLVLDLVCVLVFAAVGRASHQESSPVLGVLTTAWPFLAGAGLGWTLVRWRSHRWPTGVGPGVTVVVVTVLVGMVLRVLTGPGTAPTFVAVATLVLAALLLGWRAVAARVR
jgi:hypothetical protein